MTAGIVNCAVDEDRVNSVMAWLFNYIALEGRAQGLTRLSLEVTHGMYHMKSYLL